MKFAVQEGMLPGRSLGEKLDKAAQFGFQAIELGGHDLCIRFDEIAHAFEKHSLAVSTICGGYGGCLLDPSKAERDRAVADITRQLEAGGVLGAVGQIFVPLFGGPRLPDLMPLKPVHDLEIDLLVDLLGPLSEVAIKNKCLLLLEPLNRYETHLIRQLKDAVTVLRRVNSKGLAMMGDFFHMSIEEDDIPAAIRAAGKRIRHIHLADSQRQQPGTGHTDFRAGFQALREIGFSDYMALECGIRGQQGAALSDCVKFMQEQMNA